MLEASNFFPLNNQKMMDEIEKYRNDSEGERETAGGEKVKKEIRLVPSKKLWRQEKIYQ